MPPGSAQPDFFYDSFCTSCQSSRCRSSCVFASAVSVPRHRQVIRALPEPPLPVPVICGNSFSALKEEPLYEFPLNLGLDNPAPRHMRRFCISAIGIESPKAANLQLTRTCQSIKPEPVLESKPDDIISRAPEHKGTTFTKNIKDDESPWPVVAKIMRGLGIHVKMMISTALWIATPQKITLKINLNLTIRGCLILNQYHPVPNC